MDGTPTVNRAIADAAVAAVGMPRYSKLLWGSAMSVEGRVRA